MRDSLQLEACKQEESEIHPPGGKGLQPTRDVAQCIRGVYYGYRLIKGFAALNSDQY